MSVNLSPIGNGFQFFTNDGLPLNGGKIYTYQAGSTNPLSTYTDVNGNIPNSNPIILGTDGRPSLEIWLSAGYNYKFVLQDSSGNLIQTYDNIYGIIAAVPTVTPIPSGVICMWSGAIGSIPLGWNLCNGQNGTPDLRNRFIVAAGDSYSVAQTGGSADTPIVAHTHTATSTSVVTDPGHQHQWGANEFAKNPINSGQTSSDGVNGLGHDALTNSSTTGITVATTTTNQSTGVSGTGANIPPFYALAYIQKS